MVLRPGKEEARLLAGLTLPEPPEAAGRIIVVVAGLPLGGQGG